MKINTFIRDTYKWLIEHNHNDDKGEYFDKGFVHLDKFEFLYMETLKKQLRI